MNGGFVLNGFMVLNSRIVYEYPAVLEYCDVLCCGTNKINLHLSVSLYIVCFYYVQFKCLAKSEMET